MSGGYPDISFINEPNQSKEAVALHRYHRRIGEPPKFGININEIDLFLKKRGFNNIKSVSAESLNHTYLEIKKDNIKISPFFHLNLHFLKWLINSLDFVELS